MVNAILSDDEIWAATEFCFLPLDEEDVPRFARAVEAAVLAKLREQEPREEVAESIKVIRGIMEFITLHAGGANAFDPALAERRVNARLDKIAAAFATPQPAVAQVPQGWKLVPVEPTTAMINAGQCGCMDNDVTVCVYKEMLAAAPEAPAQGQQIAEPVRYAFFAGDGEVLFEPDPNGNWVRYSEVMGALK